MNALLLMWVLAQTPAASGPCMERAQRALSECTDDPSLCPAQEAEACDRLAGLFVQDDKRVAALAASLMDSTLREAVQPTDVGAAAPSGTPSQLGAATTAQTVPLVGASFGTTSSEDGETLLSLSVNPLGIASDTAEAFARRARLTDFSIVLPTSLTSGTRPDFVGFRADFDFVAAGRARAEFKALSDAAVAAYKDVLVAGGNFNALVRELLAQGDEAQRRQCLDALFADTVDANALITACGAGELLRERIQASAAAEAGFRSAVNRFREVVDASHGGLNLQLDVPASKSSSKPFRAALAAAGTHDFVTGASWSAGADVSLEGDYLLQAGEGALGGALAVDLRASGDLRDSLKVEVTAGVKGHLGQKLREGVVGDTARSGNYLESVLGARVPLGDLGLAVTGNVTWNIAGDDAGPPVFSVSVDYSRLLNAAR
ncbi:MAG TPA: hypothetical protein VE153_13375 [Myxococcus sp.]|nr:hypothetical protein [Myxococcus sp.]